MNNAQRLIKMNKFYNSLKTETSLQDFSDADHNSFDDLRNSIEENNGFDIEIIYYSRAMEYLKDNDNSLRESLQLADELGYEPKNLSSEILASLLASQNARSEFEKLENEITSFFDELNNE